VSTVIGRREERDTHIGELLLEVCHALLGVQITKSEH